MTTAEFIQEYREKDTRQLALQSARFPDVDMPYALDQIKGWQTARRKLPTWAACDGIVYPPHLSMEQCSSEPTAQYKLNLAMEWSCRVESSHASSMTDLSGGFGVDFSFTSCAFASATYVERNAQLCSMVEHNLPLLGIDNAKVVCADAVDYLSTLDMQTMIFLDPARRDQHGAKTVMLADCTPDVVQLLPQLLKKSRFTMLKLSPMLDWHKAIADLDGSVAEVHIVALQGECKELLLVLDASLHGNLSHPVRIVCADMVRDNGGTACGQVMPGLRTLTFEYELHTGSPDEPAPSVAPDAMLRDTTLPLFLHEPNAAVMKAGCFGRMAERFGVMAVSRNSHLFLARSMAADFPGRTFVVEAVGTMNRKELRTMLAGTEKANIAVRNFPLSADALRKRLKLGDGGETYIFATTSAAGDHLLFKCRKGKEGD